jgi:hypothetical protein
LLKAAKHVRALDGPSLPFGPKDLTGDHAGIYKKLPTALKEDFIRAAAIHIRVNDLCTQVDIAMQAVGPDTPAGRALADLIVRATKRRKPYSALLATQGQITAGVGGSMEEVKGGRWFSECLDKAESCLTSIKTLKDYIAADSGPLRKIGVELSKSVTVNQGNQDLLKLQALWNQRSDVIYALVKGQALARTKALQKVARENLKDEQLRLEKADVDALRKRWADLIELARKEYLQHFAAKT